MEHLDLLIGTLGIPGALASLVWAAAGGLYLGQRLKNGNGLSTRTQDMMLLLMKQNDASQQMLERLSEILIYTKKTADQLSRIADPEYIVLTKRGGKS